VRTRLRSTVGIGLLATAIAVLPVANAQARGLSQWAAAEATKTLVGKAADRMADQCRRDFCLDANEYSIEACERIAGRKWRCAYTVYGWTYDAREPVGDFACSRSALIKIDRGGRVRARSTGKTACGDDPWVNQTYPWPQGGCRETTLSDGSKAVMCWVVAAPPQRTLYQPLRRRGPLPR